MRAEPSAVVVDTLRRVLRPGKYLSLDDLCSRVRRDVTQVALALTYLDSTNEVRADAGHYTARTADERRLLDQLTVRGPHE
jgi:hypothetical protein